MFVARGINLNPALLRSAMFPAWYARPVYISLLWSEENFLVARSINISSLRDEELLGMLKTPNGESAFLSLIGLGLTRLRLQLAAITIISKHW